MVTHPRTRELINGIHPPLVNKIFWDKYQEARIEKTA
jgi:hypothetical protein